VKDTDSVAALHKAIDMGVNFIDNADVYGDGRSEKLIAQVCKDRSEEIIVATKAGRRLDPHAADGYNRENLMKFVERSLKNLEVDALDLVQLHCPPTEVYYRPEVFDIMDDLQKQGKIQHYGVSVEKVEEALKAIEFPNVKTVQIIFNMFRQRPSGLFSSRPGNAVSVSGACASCQRLIDRKNDPQNRVEEDFIALLTGMAKPLIKRNLCGRGLRNRIACC
jgi:aryl-alcohol dehydrogenase-like predicted oxidoreductase